MRDKPLNREVIFNVNSHQLLATMLAVMQCSSPGTLADGDRIATAVVDDEINRLKRKWQTAPQDSWAPSAIIDPILGSGSSTSIDYYEQLKLANLIQVCKDSRSMAEAGRKLFNISRENKKSVNDSHRVKQLLEKYGISFDDISASAN